MAPVWHYYSDFHITKTTASINPLPFEGFDIDIENTPFISDARHHISRNVRHAVIKMNDATLWTYHIIFNTSISLTYVISVFFAVVSAVAALHKPSYRPNPIPYRQCRLTDSTYGFAARVSVPRVVLQPVAPVSEPDTIRWRHSPKTLYPAPTRWRRYPRYGQWKSRHRFCRPDWCGR